MPPERIRVGSGGQECPPLTNSMAGKNACPTISFATGVGSVHRIRRGRGNIPTVKPLNCLNNCPWRYFCSVLSIVDYETVLARMQEQKMRCQYYNSGRIRFRPGTCRILHRLDRAGGFNHPSCGSRARLAGPGALRADTSKPGNPCVRARAVSRPCLGHAEKPMGI